MKITSNGSPTRVLEVRGRRILVAPVLDPAGLWPPSRGVIPRDGETVELRAMERG